MNIETSFEKCVFAKWGLGIDSHSQYGCYFDRIEKFKKAGAKVEEKSGRGGYYYSINRLCNRCFQTDNTLPIEEYAKLAIERTKLEFDVIISPPRDNVLISLIDFYKKLDPQPQNLIVLDQFKRKETFLKILQDAHLPKWDLVTEAEKVPSFDDGIDKVTSKYFWIPDYYSGWGSPIEYLDLPPKNILSVVDNFYNERMQDFYLLFGDYGVLSNLAAYRMFVNKSYGMVTEFLQINHKYDLKLPKKVFQWNEVESQS